MNHTPKKIVSKGEYAKALVERVGTGGIGGLYVVLSGLGVLCLLWCVGTSAYLIFRDRLNFDLIAAMVTLVSFLVLFICIIGKWGIKLLKEAKTMPVNIPLTRANTADLPADESLVRASEVPQVPQQAVLLRPATETDKTPSEQLLRPS